MGFSRTDDELEKLKQSRTYSKSSDQVDKNSSGNTKRGTSEKFSAYKKLITPGLYNSAKKVSKSHDELR